MGNFNLTVFNCRLQSVLPDVLFSGKFGYFFIWLAVKSCVWWVADFLAIFAIFRREIWQVFVQDSDQCLVHKKL